MADGPEYEGEIPQEVADEIDNMIDAATRQMRQRLEEIEAELAAELARAKSDTLSETEAELAALHETTLNEVKVSTLTQPRVENITIETEMAADSVLELPLSYMAGTNTLQVYRNGILQAPGEPVNGGDYSETGQPGQLSAKIILHAGARVDDLFTVLVFPLNSGYQAERSAEAAAESQRAAALEYQRVAAVAQSMGEAVNEARQEAARATAAVNAAAVSATSEIEQAAGNAADAQTEAAGYADVSRRYAELAKDAADECYRLAAVTANQSERPFIKALPSVDDLAGQPSGVYIINEELAAPTQALGIYAANTEEDMKFDGIFYVSKSANVPGAALPPTQLPPAEVERLGNSESWLPCEHGH